MATHQLAQGLASLGRHGDSMLMHVSPSEVEGLSALGKMTGHKLHTNPHTGMPEAFDFGDFFTSLLPTLAGVALAPTTGGASLGLTGLAAQAAPIVGGMATGALVAGAKGDDPLMGGLMGGLGGFGGAGLAKSLGNLGAGAGVSTGTTATTPVAQGQGATGAMGFSDAGQAPLSFQAPGQGGLALNTAAADATQSLASSASPYENLLTGAKQLTGMGDMTISDAYKQFTTPVAQGGAGGSGLQLAAPVGMAALSGAQEDLYPEPDMSMEEKRKAEENKYRDPRTGLLNLAQASPGLKLMATGGTVGANSSTISSGGIQDLYGTNDQTTGTQNLSKEGYGIGRLNSLAAEGSRAKAADTFYAMGGPIAFAKGGHQGYLDGEGDGMSDSIPATIEGKQPARLADGEFVIPADVVSHIGNGSSKAGSKQLYAMLDRIRKARTGHTKQGKEIKPHKYMPA